VKTEKNKRMLQRIKLCKLRYGHRRWAWAIESAAKMR